TVSGDRSNAQHDRRFDTEMLASGFLEQLHGFWRLRAALEHTPGLERQIDSFPIYANDIGVVEQRRQLRASAAYPLQDGSEVREGRVMVCGAIDGALRGSVGLSSGLSRR